MTSNSRSSSEAEGGIPGNQEDGEFVSSTDVTQDVPSSAGDEPGEALGTDSLAASESAAESAASSDRADQPESSAVGEDSASPVSPTETLGTDGGYRYAVTQGSARIIGLADDVDPGSIVELVVPSELGGVPVSSIEPGAFLGCPNLVCALVPPALDTFADDAFPAEVILVSTDASAQARTSLGIAEASAALDAAYTESNNRYGHAYSTWSYPTQSYLAERPDGSLERVEFIDGTLIVERLSADMRSVTSLRTIPANTYRPSGLPSGSSTLWGGFFSGTKYNFVVTGQSNPNESDSLSVIRVTRYSKDWSYQKNFELKGANISTPFNYGSCDMAEKDGVLYVHTCRTMYTTSDGLRHQSNTSVILDEETMQRTDDTYLGYASHSFNQYVATLGDQVYAVDHGDAYPRAIVLTVPGEGRHTLFDYPGAVGNNSTGASVGGIAACEARGTILVAGDSIDRSEFDNPSSPVLTRNIWVTVTPANDLDATKTVWLTSYPKGGKNKTATTPFIVQAGDDKFLVIWGFFDYSKSGDDPAQRGVSYVFVNGSGKTLTKVATVTASLSDCEPVLSDGKLVWYVSGSDTDYFGSDGPVSVYSIDAATGAFSALEAIDDAEVTLAKRVYYTAGGSARPTPTVKVGGKTLKAGRDYSVSYKNNSGTGTATLIVTGKGSYMGEARVTFEVALFSDTPADAWYMRNGWISHVASTGLMTGYANTDRFGPEDQVTRAQVAIILYRYANPGSKATTDKASYGTVTHFSDVPKGAYYTAAVEWAYQQGIVTGYGNTGRFGPDDPVTREQLATMMWRFAKSQGASMKASGKAFNQCRETGAVSAFARDAMIWCADRGVITGVDRDGVGYLQPQGNATRAQMAKIITVVTRDVL